MADTLYYELLQEGLPEDLTVSRIVRGISWTAGEALAGTGSGSSSAPGPLGLQRSCRWPGSAQIPGRAPGPTGGHSPCHGKLWDRASQAQWGRDVQEGGRQGDRSQCAPGRAVHTLHRRSSVPGAPGVMPCAGQRPG